MSLSIVTSSPRIKKFFASAEFFIPLPVTYSKEIKSDLPSLDPNSLRPIICSDELPPSISVLLSEVTAFYTELISETPLPLDRLFQERGLFFNYFNKAGSKDLVSFRSNFFSSNNSDYDEFVEIVEFFGGLIMIL